MINAIENYLGLQTIYSTGEAVIKRDKYLKQLIDKQNNGLIKVKRDEDGFTTMSIWDFLLKENSLEL